MYFYVNILLPALHCSISEMFPFGLLLDSLQSMGWEGLSATTTSNLSSVAVKRAQQRLSSNNTNE